MRVKLTMSLLVFLFVTTMVQQMSGADTSFMFNNGFQSANLTMDGISEITSNGLLQLTNETKLQTGAHSGPYLGLFNKNNDGDPTNHVLAVELDIIQSMAIQCKCGWTMMEVNGEAQNLDIWKLPTLPQLDGKQSIILPVALALVSLCLVVFVSLFVYCCYIKRKRKFSEIVEEWEQNYGPHRFKYKDLYFATKGFGEKEVLGFGGFGKVYKGMMPDSKIEVAVKKVSHDSKQGIREFISEIVSIGRLRHRNLVSLLGYCRRKGELLLVYEFMPNGSLDKYLYNQPKVTLNWMQRFKIIKGVALGLCYLHEEWEQVVVHRDVKASNVMLDSEFNGRLGDFGLARLYDHDVDPTTTHVAGTLGYVAPETMRTGRATTKSDVFSFGAFMLEVVGEGHTQVKLVMTDPHEQELKTILAISDIVLT
ncbi:hypothetical protein K1719_016693 [Acacia pycnantha]|nr:hypothetical protein K1719_016693 [Acacia pycnantha]